MNNKKMKIEKIKNPRKNYYHVIILLVAFLASAVFFIKNNGFIPLAYAAACPASGFNNPTLTTGCTFSGGVYEYTGTVTIASGSTVTLPSASTVHTTGNFNIYGTLLLYTNQQLNLADGTLTIGDGTHAALIDIKYTNGGTYTDDYIISLKAGSIYIAANAVIGKIGNGRIQNSGTGKGSTGSSAYGSLSGGGGGHGGAGGKGCAWNSGSCTYINGGAAYDSSINPAYMGSGGGGSTGYAGGNGGGYIMLQAPNGTITINGYIHAEGAVGGNGSQYYAGGGGSGGAVYIIANTLSGSGTINTSGGVGGVGGTGYACGNTTPVYGGGGGGGIIYYSYTNLSSWSPTITANGASGGCTNSNTMGANGIINSYAAPGVTVTSPNGGESWVTDSVHSITWTSVGVIDHFRVSYSTNSGGSWTVLSSSATSPYSWTIPVANTSLGLVKVEALDGSNAILATDVSNGNFTMVQFQVTAFSISDTGGYTNSTTPSMTITSSGFTPTHMSFSCNGGTNWSSDIIFASPTTAFDITNVATGCSSANGSKTITARVKSAEAGYTTSNLSDTTYYDNTPPSVSSFTANNTSTTQIQLTPVANDSGSGLNSSPYYYTMSAGASCSRASNTGYISTNPYTWGGLSANTQYSFDVKTRDALTNESGYSACQILYTSASTPGAPTVNTPTATTLNVTPVTGGAQKDISIYVEAGSSCDYSGGLGYVQADGSINNSTEVFQTIGAWGEKTVTGFSANTQYAFCSRARNGDNVVTSIGSAGTGYTSANTPGAPTVNTPTLTTLNVTPVTGGAQKDISIYVETGSSCDYAGGLGYVQANGSINTSEIYQTIGAWGAKTVTGFSANTQYAFCSRARNGDNVVTSIGSAGTGYTAANTPGAPTVNTPTLTTLNVTPVTGGAQKDISIYVETGSSCDYSGGMGYVQADGSINNSTEVFQTIGAWGAKTVTGFSANTQYAFCSRARNGDNVVSSVSPATAVYTSANTPTTAGSTNPTSSSIRLTWASGGAQTDYAYGTTSGCLDGTTANAFLDISGLTANTAVTRYICARNGNGDKTSALTVGPFYTLVNTPITPGHTNLSPTGMRWTWASGGTQTDYAYGTTSACSTGTTSGTSWDESSLSVNTSYTRYVCARNGSGVKTPALQIGPFYTAADTPINPGYSNPTSSSIRLTWMPGGVQSTYYYFGTTSDCPDGATSSTYIIVSVPTPNTAVTRYVCATNNESDNTPALQIGPFYSGASTPAAPSISNPTLNTMDVNPVSGGAEKDMSIYVAAGSYCNYSGGIGYVQADGSINTGEVYQTAASWGTVTVTGLSANTQYSFCSRARNNNDNITGIGSAATAYSAANMPTTPGSANSTSSSIRLTWVSGGAQTDYAYGTTSGCLDGTTSNAFLDISGLSVNTAVTRYVCAMNGSGDKTYSLIVGPFYTSVSVPITPGRTNQTANSMRWTWASGGVQTDYAYGNSNTCSTGTTSNTYWDQISLSANTSYTRYVCARNGSGIKTSSLTIGPFYTAANTPGIPVLGNIGVTSVSVTPVSGGTEKDMAIYVATGSAGSCDGTNGIGYVQANGTISAGEVFQTVLLWGTKTVTGLTGSTAYYFCAQARNGDNELTPFGSTSTETTLSPNLPLPSVSSLSPTSINGDFNGSATSFTLTVNGSNFVSDSVVRWNGNNRATHFVNSGQLTATILSSDLTVYDTFPVTVFSPAPGGGTSGAKIFTVVDPLPIATHFPPEHGSTDFTAAPVLTNLTSVKLANPAGAIQWTAPVTVMDQNFDNNVKIGTGYVSLNTSSLHPTLDAPAHVSLHVLDCYSYKAYYSAGFWSALDDIKSHGHECGATTSPACTNMACSDNTLTFDVPHFDSYGAEGSVQPSVKGIPTTLDISNAVPVITAGPSDGGSSVNTPTNEGSDVHFTATATDGNFDGYFLTVCKTDSITPNGYAPPSCATGQEICTSTEAASGSEASCNFGTLGFSGESQDWYAFVCDYNSDPLCSPVSQGTGDSGSPFKVNHAGTFGTVTVTNTSDGAIVPGDTLKFTLPNARIADPDTDGTQDLLTMHICTEGTTGYDYVSHTCTGGTEICSSPATDPASADAVCTGGASLVSVPTAHGDYGFKVYVEDNHNFPAVGTDSQTYTVTDVPPQVMSYSGPDTPAPSAGGSDDISFIVTIHDDNGDNDVTSVNGVFYDTAAKSLTSGLCASAEKDCYLAATCTPANVSTPAGTGKTAAGTDNELTASCTVTVWFNADYSDGWKAHVNVSDGTHDITSSADSGAVTNPALLGINVTEAGIVYGTVAIGGTSQAVETSMGNMGNQTLDVYVNGTPMTSGSYSIPVSQQKWYHTSAPFDWDASPGNEGPFALAETPSGTTAAGGCVNRNILVRPVHDSSSTNESVYWKLRIPSSQQAGSYSGQNTFSTTSGDTCTGAEF
jgi:hypothetical protein